MWPSLLRVHLRLAYDFPPFGLYPGLRNLNLLRNISPSIIVVLEARCSSSETVSYFKPFAKTQHWSFEFHTRSIEVTNWSMWNMMVCWGFISLHTLEEVGFLPHAFLPPKLRPSRLIIRGEPQSDRFFLVLVPTVWFWPLKIQTLFYIPFQLV